MPLGDMMPVIKDGQGQHINPVSRQDSKYNVLLGLSGSVAAIKLEELAEKLSTIANLKIVTTSAAKHFLDSNAKWGSQVIDDENEWRMWKQKGDPVQHIQLSQWADILLIAPLSANTMAKIAHVSESQFHILIPKQGIGNQREKVGLRQNLMLQGFCDNLLTCIVRAWNTSDFKPIILAPAMNTLMWTNAMTSRHMTEIEECYHATFVSPIEKKLACGDVGIGAMANVDDIHLTVLKTMKAYDTLHQV